MTPSYEICVIDIGSPKLENIGWCVDDNRPEPVIGTELPDLFQYFQQRHSQNGILLALEAPLFVPVRDEPMNITKGRLGEGNRP